MAARGSQTLMVHDRAVTTGVWRSGRAVASTGGRGSVVAAALQQVIIVRSDRVIWSVSVLRFTSVAAGDRAYAETVALARKQAKRVP